MIANLDQSHIDIVLLTNRVARLACCHNDRPYIVPITYVFDQGYVYGHTNNGEKLRILRQNPHVCLEVDEIQDLGHWRSVVVSGVFEELHGQEAVNGLDLIMSRLSPYVISSTSLPAGEDTDSVVHKQIRLRPTKGVVYRIRITEASGRYEQPQAKPHHEGQNTQRGS